VKKLGTLRQTKQAKDLKLQGMEDSSCPSRYGRHCSPDVFQVMIVPCYQS